MADHQTLLSRGIPPTKRPRVDSTSSDASDVLSQLLDLPDDLLPGESSLASTINNLDHHAVNSYLPADQSDQSGAGVMPGNGPASVPNMQSSPLVNSNMNNQPPSAASVATGYAASPHPLNAPSPASAVVSTSADPTPTLPAISSSPATSNTMAAPSPNLRPSFPPTPPAGTLPMDNMQQLRGPISGNPPPYYPQQQNHSPASSPYGQSPMGVRPPVRIGYGGPQMQPSHVSHSVDIGHMNQGYPGGMQQHPMPPVFQNTHPSPNSHGLPHSGGMMGPRPSLLPDGHSPQGMQPPPSQPLGGMSGGMGGPPTGAASNDPEKRKLIQQQLVLLLHAHRCQQREREQQANGEFRPCGLPHCRTMKNVLNHMTECQAGRDCTFPHCASSRQIIYHWKNCQQQECPVCLPLKTASLAGKRGTDPIPPYPGMPPHHQSPVMVPGGRMPGGGLPPHNSPGGYPGSMADPNYHPTLGGPPGSIGGPFDPFNPSVGGHRGDASQSSASNLIFRPSHNLSQPPQHWHSEVTSELRSHLIKKLVEAIYFVPLQDPVALQDPRVAHLVQYAINVEKSMFENARSRESYYQLLAERIYRIRKELDERKKLKRTQAEMNNPDNQSLFNGGVPDIPAHTPHSSQPTPVPNMSIGSPSLSNDDSAHKLSVPTPSTAGIKPSPSPLQRLPSEPAPSAAATAAVLGLDNIKQEPKEEPGLTGKAEMGSGTPLGNGPADIGGKPLSVKSSGSPKQRLNSMSEPHSIQPISSVKSERSDAPPPSAASSAVLKSGPTKIQPDASLRVSFTPEEIEAALRPAFQQVWDQDPEAYPFRQPVDPQALGIPDYFNIIKNPIDLSAIHKKLRQGAYTTNPWKFCEDMWLMFDNAWLYNKKTSRVYKFCTKLSEVFDECIDTAMQSLGYCCGRRHAFHPQVLYCNGKPLCTVPRDSPYHGYQNKCVYCPKCFSEVEGDAITLRDGTVQNVPKSAFKELKNDAVEYEPMVECMHCQRQMHRICVLHHDSIWPEGYQCYNCLRSLKSPLRENRYTAKRLPTTKLGNFLEERVNGFLRNDADVGKVTIRVVSSSDKILDTRLGMRERFLGEFPTQFPYRTKALFAFQECDGVDVCFFGMHVQEYGSDCPAPNTRRVYISYLDSVYFFRPKQYRTLVYHEILIGYLQFCKLYGFQTAHIWACPPGEGDDYIFHCHPIEQKIPKPKRLVEWYRKMLDRGQQSHVVYDHKDIFRHCTDEEITTVTEIPYFEGDFWPNVIEETIKELDMEEEEERKASEAACVDPTRPGPKKAGKRNTSKKGSKKAGASRSRNNKKSSLNIGGDLLSQKIYQTMEKHKEVFFIVLLQPPNQSPLNATTDPDSLITCDLMDGRDAFLNLARERHWEFSSLRRSKFSTQALLYELHQGGDRFVYTCNNCRSDIETRWHCTVCEDFDLCDSCYKISGHTHRMEKLEYEPDGSEEPQTNTVEARNNSIRRRIEYLIHASQCHDSNCRQPYCIKMKQLLRHTRDCKLRQAGTCMICKHFILLCVTHARECKENKCQLRVCASIKQKLREQRLQQQNRNFEHVQRRMHRMATLQAANAQQGSSPASNSSPGNKSVLSPATTQSPCPPVAAPTPGKAAAVAASPKAAPSTPGDISTPKPPPSVTIPPSPMQNPGTPFHSPYTPMAKPQEPSANMAMQQPTPPNQIQPPMNPEDNIRHIIEAYLSPNAPDKIRAINYLKEHAGIIPRVIMMLQRQGRVQEAQQLQMETGAGMQSQQPYGYPVPQQQQQPQVPSGYMGNMTAPSQMQIQHQQAAMVARRQHVQMNPQHQMIHHPPMQPSYPPHRMMHTQYGNPAAMVQPQRMPGSQMYNSPGGNPVAGPMTANPPTQQQSQLAQMLQSSQPYHNQGTMQYRMNAPPTGLGPPPQYSSQGPAVMRPQTHQPGYPMPMMGPQQTMGRPMHGQQMMGGGMPPNRPIPMGYNGMQDPNMGMPGMYQQPPAHHQPYGMNTNTNNSSSSYLLGPRTHHY